MFCLILEKRSSQPKKKNWGKEWNRINAHLPSIPSTLIKQPNKGMQKIFSGNQIASFPFHPSKINVNVLHSSSSS